MEIRNVQEMWVIGVAFILDYEEKMSEFYETLPYIAYTPEFKALATEMSISSKKYGENVRKVLNLVGAKPQEVENAIAQGMRKATETMLNLSKEGPVRDAAVIVELNQQSLFRVATYGSMLTYAKLLEHDETYDLIQSNLAGSRADDVKLTRLAQDVVNPAAMRLSEKPGFGS